MKSFFLFLLILCFPFFSLAGVGDEYFCEETQDIAVEDHKVKNHKSDRFAFRLDENEIIFIEGRFFVGWVLDVLKDSESDEEIFSGFGSRPNVLASLKYDYGYLLLSMNRGRRGSTIISARCVKTREEL